MPRQFLNGIGSMQISFTKSGILTASYVGTFRWYNDSGATRTIVAVRASVGVAPTGAAVRPDLNKNGTTMYTTQGNRPNIAVSTFTHLASLPDVLTVANADYLTADVDTVGSTIAGSDLVLTVWMI